MSTIINMSQYPKLLDSLRKQSDQLKIATMRYLARTDLYFLLRYVLNRPDVEQPWLFDRCREVQLRPNGYLDLWAREHYKSTIITYAKSIQDVIASHGEDALWDREATLGIFSFNRGKALDFVSQIKYEFENNKLLKSLFPDVLYESPSRESSSWSVMGGLVVKRQGNPKEATIEGWGLVDSMPTGSHFFGRIYDDVITEQFARSPEMIAKTTESWELSLNLGARGGYERYIGTRYHYNDTYRPIMRREAAIPRIYAATKNGKVDGEPVFLTREELAKKRRTQGPYVFSCQMLQDPKADEVQGFKREWLKHYHKTDGSGMNKYILVDPANEKKKTSDYTVIVVIGLGMDKNYYLLDAIRDRLNLQERTECLINLHRQWRPNGVGYEKYGKDADIEHIEYVQEQENYRFDITPLGGSMAKNDRIRRLIPLFEQGRIYLPGELHKVQYDGKTVDLIESFINEEYDAFPVAIHDDFLDAMARITEQDLDIIWPKVIPMKSKKAVKKNWRMR